MIEYLVLGTALYLLSSSSKGAVVSPTPTSLAPIPSSITGRERAMLERIRETAPHLLNWVPLPITMGAHTATFFVSPDYWGIGNDPATYQRIPLTPKAGQWVADQLGAMLPTKNMVDMIERRATIVPFVAFAPRSGESRNAQRLWDESNAAAQRRMPLEGGLVAGHKKDILVGNVLARNPGKVIIYGGRYPDNRLVQSLSALHGDFYVDYSHGVRLVKNEMIVDGAMMNVSDVLRDRTLAGLVSDEGPVPVNGQRYPT